MPGTPYPRARRSSRRQITVEQKIYEEESSGTSESEPNDKSKKTQALATKKFYRGAKPIDSDDDFQVMRGRRQREDSSDSEDPIRPKKKMLLKNHQATKSRKIAVKSSDFESDSDDIENKQANKQDKGNKGTSSSKMTEYEKLRQRNIAEKLAFLEKLNIPQAVQNVVRAMGPGKGRPKGSIGKKVKKEVYVPISSRPKSLRLQRLDPDKNPLPESSPSSSLEDPDERMERKPSRDLELSDVAIDDVEKGANFLKSVHQALRTYNKDDFKPLSHEEHFDVMQILRDDVRKVVPNRITAMAVHPSSSVVIAAGCMKGFLGIWHMGSESGHDGVSYFRPHVGAISCLKYSADKLGLYSSSYDGTMRYFDLKKQVFQQVFATSEDSRIERYNYNPCNFFDYLSEDSVIVTHYDGTVSICDTRIQSSSARTYHLHDRRIKTVDVHPMNKNHFVTAMSVGGTYLWDLRTLKKHDTSFLAEMPDKKSVTSAFFSPETGNKILTTSLDNKIKIFNNLGENITSRMTIRHNNQSGRWLSPIQAVWLPNNENLFAVGSLGYPKCIEVFNADTGLMNHRLSGEHYGLSCTLVGFHPQLPIVFGGSSTGKILMFKSKKYVPT